jgi:SAM-dependent methyltransferase
LGTGLTPRPCEVCEQAAGTVALCTGRDYLLGSPGELFRAVRCAHCGFAFLESPPTDLAPYYPAGYFSSGGETPSGLGWARRVLAGREARWLRSQVPQVRSALEVGPGRGDFLLVLRAACPGSAIRGFDITTEAGLRSIAPGVVVSYAASLDAAGLGQSEFDLIVMRHVLEHVPDLAGFLREVRRLSSPGGTLYVKVPNRSSWASRLFGRYWYGLDFPRHLRYFSTSDLATALRRAGFRVVRTGHESDAVDWVGSIRFLCADRLRLPARGDRRWAAVFFGIRILLLPLSLLARLCKRSSRVWVLARREDG